MIRYSLICGNGHEFESWFGSSGAFDEAAEADRLECPFCQDHRIEKAVMAPSVSSSTRKKGGDAPSPTDAAEKVSMMMSKVRRHVEENYEYVGDQFADEARRIHYEETERRDIYGEATIEEAGDLVAEGVEVAPLPGPDKKQVN